MPILPRTSHGRRKTLEHCVLKYQCPSPNAWEFQAIKLIIIDPADSHLHPYDQAHLVLAELGDIRSFAGRLQEAMGTALCAIHPCNAAASVDAEQQGGWGPASQADACECLDLR